MSLHNLLKTFSDETIIVREDNKYVEKSVEGVSLKGVLQRGRLRLNKAKKPYPRGVGFRPSDMTYKYCKRARIGQIAGQIQIYNDKVTPKLQLVFDVGHAYHDIIQGYFWDIGQLKGSFKCIKCDKIYHDLIAPESCPSGIASHTRSSLVFKEVKATSDEYMISGRSDGILVIEGIEHLLDIKSIANRTIKTPERQFCFEDLESRGPKQEHIVQLMLYMWMLDIQRGHLFYVAKNDHQIKSFAIPYDETIITPYLEEIKGIIETANALKAGNRVKLPPTCSDDKCKCHEVLPKFNA